MTRSLIFFRAAWYSSYTGQKAFPSASVSCMLAATSSFLSALTFWRRISMSLEVGLAEGLAVALCWAMAGMASAAAIARGRIFKSFIVIVTTPSVWKKIACAATSVEVRVLVVFGALGGKLEREAVVRELVDPDSRRDRHRAGVELGSLSAHLGARRRLGAELPAAVDELVEPAPGLEHPHEPELLHPEPEAGLHLDHPHEGFLPGLVVDRDSRAPAAAREQDLHAEVGEYRVARGAFDRRVRMGLRLVKPLERSLHRRANVGLPILFGGGKARYGHRAEGCEHQA